MNGTTKEIQKLEKEKAKAQLNNNLKQEAELCNALGELYAQNGQYKDALREHQDEQQLSESLNDLIGAAVANRKIGECYQELGDYQKALKHQQKHLSLAQSADNFVEQQRALATIGRTYLCQAESLDHGDSEKQDVIEKAKAAFLGSMDLCELHLQGVISNKEYQDMRGRLFLNLGLVFDCQKDIKNSVKFILQAIHIAQKNSMKEDLIRCNLALSDIHQSGGEVAKSLRCLENALQVAKELKNKNKESTVLWLLGNAHFHQGDFIAAKRALKKAYKLGSENSQERSRVIRSLKIAIRCCKLDKEIEKFVSESDYKQQMVLEEEIADLCCKTNSYDEAIKHYKKQLECAISLQVPEVQLVPIYVSLAATYADNEQYSSAVDMYRKELELRKGNPEEECRTWLNVADAQEKAGQEYEILHQSYNKAIEYASSAGLPKLQYEALKSLKLVQEHFKEETHLSATNKKLSHLKGEHDLVSDDEESIEDTGNTEHSNTLEINTEDLVLSDSGQSEEDEEYDRPLAARRVQRAKFTRTNEKGETLLHRACIEGNLKQVKSLLIQGHPVNPRDHCGWLPLHEACNHDHYDIVEVLLEHGAHINDRGGAKCGGITPLHDAVCCGNLEVAELLINKGASVIVKDDKGLTPLETLERWRETYETDLDQDVKDNSEKVKQLLIDAAQGPHNRATDVINTAHTGLLNSDLFDNEEDSQRQSQTDTVRLSQSSRVRRGVIEISRPGIRTLERSLATRRNTRDASSSSESEDEDKNDNFRMKKQTSQLVLDDLPTIANKRIQSCTVNNTQEVTNGSPPGLPGSHTDCVTSSHVFAENEEVSDRVQDVSKWMSEDAKTTYCSAMARVGSAASRLAAKQHSNISATPSPQPGSTNPLLDEQEYVVDDWLVEDVMPMKRRRVDGGTLGETTSRLGSSQNASLKLSRKKQKQTQLKLTGLVSQTQRTSNASKQDGTDAEESNVEEVLQASPPAISQLTPSGLEQPHQGVIKSPPSAKLSVMRVKVRVQEKMLLISVPLSTPKTIQWLSDETSNRYYTSTGLRPQLSVTTADNALFSPEDVITEILSNNEEVFAIVKSWDLPPLYERYNAQCEKVQQREHSIIKSRLQQTKDPNDVDLTGLLLNQQHLRPLFMVLPSQYALRTLLLTRNRIDDTLVGLLADALESLPNLYHIDLSSNEITHEGLQKISETLFKDSTGDQNSVSSSTPLNSQKPLQHLEKLILSYNPLTDSCALYIANIVKHCPLLSELTLSSTNLTTYFFQLHRMALVEAFQGAKCLQYLNVSHNALGSTGVDLMLNCLNPERIKCLELSSVIPKVGDSNLTKHLATFFSKGNCAIQKLTLEDCRLNDEDMNYLSKCIPGLIPVCWTYLCLSTNPHLTAAGLRTLLTTFQESHCSLESLDVSMCGLESPLDGAMFDLLAGFMTRSHPSGETHSHPSGETLSKLVLSNNKLDKMDMEVLMNVWEVAYGDRANHFTYKNRFILST